MFFCLLACVKRLLNSGCFLRLSHYTHLQHGLISTWWRVRFLRRKVPRCTWNFPPEIMCLKHPLKQGEPNRQKIYSIKYLRDSYVTFDPFMPTDPAMVFTMAAEIERGLISERTKEALRARRASGLPVGRPERPRQKQAGQAPSGNRGDDRQRVHPEVHRDALQFFACQPRKLAEEARNQETEAVKSYGGFGTFA